MMEEGFRHDVRQLNCIADECVGRNSRTGMRIHVCSIAGGQGGNGMSGSQYMQSVGSTTKDFVFIYTQTVGCRFERRLTKVLPSRSFVCAQTASLSSGTIKNDSSALLLNNHRFFSAN